MRSVISSCLLRQSPPIACTVLPLPTRHKLLQLHLLCNVVETIGQDCPKLLLSRSTRRVSQSATDLLDTQYHYHTNYGRTTQSDWSKFGRQLDLSQDAPNRPIPRAIQRTNSLVSRSLGSDCPRSVHRDIALQHRWIHWFARSEHVLT